MIKEVKTENKWLSDVRTLHSRVAYMCSRWEISTGLDDCHCSGGKYMTTAPPGPPLCCHAVTTVAKDVAAVSRFPCRMWHVLDGWDLFFRFRLKARDSTSTALSWNVWQEQEVCVDGNSLSCQSLLFWQNSLFCRRYIPLIYIYNFIWRIYF